MKTRRHTAPPTDNYYITLGPVAQLPDTSHASFEAKDGADLSITWPQEKPPMKVHGLSGTQTFEVLTPEQREGIKAQDEARKIEAERKPTKFCYDCKHNYENSCNSKNRDVDLVTGRAVYLQCRNARADDALCGKAGKWFAPLEK